MTKHAGLSDEAVPVVHELHGTTDSTATLASFMKNTAMTANPEINGTRTLYDVDRLGIFESLKASDGSASVEMFYVEDLQVALDVNLNSKDPEITFVTDATGEKKTA
ncbi:hypothetical protein FRB90_007837 [Tulasnella sp. 427]|nr:hypothetical protein FRB90_007837 [Tulasnella sp. 427]